MTWALFRGNMLRERKYRLALCFRVLSNQYVERNAYANVFNFNKENKSLERAKVNSRCFHWFPVGLQHGASILNTIIFSDTFCRIARVRKIAHSRNFVTLFMYYSSTIFIEWLVILFFTCVIIKLTCVT